MCTEGYMATSPRKVSNLQTCIELCKLSFECKSITVFKSNWCSHFRGFCGKRTASNKAMAAAILSIDNPPADTWTKKILYDEDRNSPTGKPSNQSLCRKNLFSSVQSWRLRKCFRSISVIASIWVSTVRRLLLWLQFF